MINTMLNSSGQVQGSIHYIHNELGIGDNTVNNVGVCPNPTTGVLFVSNDLFKHASFEILNALDQVVKQRTMNGSSIHVADLNAEFHILKQP